MNLKKITWKFTKSVALFALKSAAFITGFLFALATPYVLTLLPKVAVEALCFLPLLCLIAFLAGFLSPLTRPQRAPRSAQTHAPVFAYEHEKVVEIGRTAQASLEWNEHYDFFKFPQPRRRD